MKPHHFLLCLMFGGLLNTAFAQSPNFAIHDDIHVPDSATETSTNIDVDHPSAKSPIYSFKVTIIKNGGLEKEGVVLSDVGHEQSVSDTELFSYDNRCKNPKDKADTKQEKQVSATYQTGSIVNIKPIKDMSAGGVFVTIDIQFISLLSMDVYTTNECETNLPRLSTLNAVSAITLKRDKTYVLYNDKGYEISIVMSDPKPVEKTETPAETPAEPSVETETPP